MSIRRLLVLGIASFLIAVVFGEILTQVLCFLLYLITVGTDDDAMIIYLGILFVVRPLLANACALLVALLGLRKLNSSQDVQEHSLTTVVKVSILTITVLVLTGIASLLLSWVEVIE